MKIVSKIGPKITNIILKLLPEEPESEGPEGPAEPPEEPEGPAEPPEELLSAKFS